MTSKEKAVQIYNKFYGVPLYIKTIKECCYLLIDEILNIEYPTIFLDELDSHIAYWQEVKNEIEKL